MPRSALTLLLALTACPGLPDDTDTNPGTDGTDPRDTQDTAPPCPEDLLEDNDAAATAVRPDALPFQGQVCEGDEDWFTVDATGGCVTVVDLSFGTDLGDLDLEVYQADQRIAVSSSTTDNEQARFFVEEDGAVQVRVVGFFGAENAYNLDVSAECEPCEQPDAFEPNDDHAGAVPATFPAMADACTTDDDWYTLPEITEDGCLLDATLQPVGAADSAVSMTLEDAGQRPITDAILAAVGIGFRALGRPGDRVGIETTTDTAYELDVEVTCAPAPPDCTLQPADIWGNQSLGTAVLMRDGVVSQGAVCDDGPDWWAVPVQDGCTTVVTLDSADAFGTLFTNGSAATPVATDGPTPVATLTTQGPHQIRVTAQNATTTYAIQADIVCGEPSE